MVAGTPITILGIDPGSRATGFGFIQVANGTIKMIESGVIRCSDQDFNVRLRTIHEEAGLLISRLQPDELAIEKVFVSRNADSALKLGAARAAVLCASFDQCSEISEYAARAVKQAVTGRGSADKEQVQHMVKIILGIGRERLAMDASDALAIAICHSHSRALKNTYRAARA